MIEWDVPRPSYDVPCSYDGWGTSYDGQVTSYDWFVLYHMYIVHILQTQNKKD